MNYDSIQIQPLKDKTDIVDSMDCVILVPFTHIVNIWHLIHHLFICYKFMKTNNINTKNMYPIFFAGFFISVATKDISFHPP